MAQTAGHTVAAPGATSKEVAEEPGVIASEWLSPPFSIDAQRMQRVSFPDASTASEGGAASKLVPVETPYEFQDLTLLKMVTPPEHEVMNYSEFAVPVRQASF